jgi:hypothetical protein
MLFFYDQNSQMGEFWQLDADGSGQIRTIKVNMNLPGSWPNIVPMNLGQGPKATPGYLNPILIPGLLFYSADGKGEFNTVSHIGDIKLVKSDPTWRSTWTQIVPINLNNDAVTDLLFYSPSEGTGQFYTVSSNGGIKLVKTHTNWRSTWTQIIPVQLDNILNTDLFFYSPSEHYGEFYTVTNSGDINLLKSLTNDR